MRTSCVIAAAAGAALAAGAYAGPGARAGAGSAAPPKRAVTWMGPEGPGINENFDSYAAGSNIGGQGGWEVWYTGGNNAPVEAGAPAAASGANKLRLIAGSDIVHRFTIDDGQWVFKIKTYVPSTSPPGVGGMVILLSQYGGDDKYAMQLALNDTTFTGTQQVPFMIESHWDGAVLPLVLNQWIEIRAEIDLVADTINTFYNNQPLGVNLVWTNNNFASGIGITSIAAVDLWSDGTNAMYFDDVSLAPDAACYPDCNADGALTVADFGCFQTKFVAGDPYADCNGDGVRTVADFGCFQTRFVHGCP